MSSSRSNSPAPSLLQQQFHTLLHSRTYPKTLCPSEVARSLSPSDLSALGVSHWRDLMPRLREMAFEARDRDEVDVLQRGELVSGERRMEDVTGPIRVRLRRKT
ncbi:uncharacterized protein Z520_09260 [Fonsecaea multimorphosa CBS 102226]|uniref:Uncharacterized protein n=1 Tax=Fonsecaea multimorphosa CBS 102226 TaxID=1442371 RepID=A0A0D2GZK1_9EURO|nr:uncharacterized protein Z520_09260 [Fonsecaea multimorphosa CBS 102226]KIX94950.1 hypothetical protein Z520_09260 [Fonsecaea multimorphosa CBS 102226]OAL20601.1 hypothetical protein AYO22_08610 [Fonsecaea multimorphosa]